MTVESWKSTFEVLSVLLLFLTFVCGFGAWYTGKIVNERLQKQVISQGPRAAVLDGESRKAFVEKLTPFSPQRVEIRYCRQSLNEYSIDHDTIGLAMLLETVMSQEAHWTVNPLAVENCGGTGVQVSVNPLAPPPVRNAADALWAALHSLPLAMVGDQPIVKESPRLAQPEAIDCGTTAKCEAKEVPFPKMGPDTIVLTVLPHP